MSQADKIRDHIYQKYIVPAIEKGEKSVSVRAGNIANELNISGNMPNVCQALGGNKLAAMCNARLEIKGINPSTTTVFTYHFDEKSPSISYPKPIFDGAAITNISQADKIRSYVYEKYIVHAIKNGEKSVTVRSGNIGKELE